MGTEMWLLRDLLQSLPCRLHSISYAGTVSRVGMTVPQYVLLLVRDNVEPLNQQEYAP